MVLTRRELLKSLGCLVAGSGLACGRDPRGSTEEQTLGTRKIPLIHTTDLYHPPQDSDDQIDLATVFALEEYDLRGVILDITERFLQAAPEGFDIARNPGFSPVAQMAHITRKSVPVAHGPIHPLRHPTDTCEDAPSEEQAGIGMILDMVADSSEPVTISVTGSPRALVAAYNREPELLTEKTHAVLVNVGSTGGDKVEWNVQLDPQAYIGLWSTELPIHWFPPGTESGAFDAAHERGTYWRAEHASLFRDLPPLLRRYFAYAMVGELHGDSISVLSQPVDDVGWQELLSAQRNLWSTASLVMGANRVLARTNEGWRFLPAWDANGAEIWPWRLDPIHADVDENGRVTWEVVDTTSRRRVFGRRAGREFGEAMTEALNSLLRGVLL